ncbi:MAG TPA: DUF309 domain-containing protein [Candidatus Acidoferrales bacterium]|nr:DUF309 domain-containing protein [Candidatus Acidoferrales bacterium]
MRAESSPREIPPPSKPARRYSTRPFPAYRYVPGLHPHPVRDPAGHSYSTTSLRLTRRSRPVHGSMNADEWFYGVDLFNAFFFWEAHEAWESLWASAADPSPQRFLFQGLIQIAAALLKAHMNVAAGARRLSYEGCTKLALAGEAQPQLLGLDVLVTEARFRAYFAVLDSGRLPQIGPDVPALLLTGDPLVFVDG